MEIASIVIAAIKILVTVPLLIAAYKNSRPMLLLPWLIFAIVTALMAIGTGIASVINSSGKETFFNEIITNTVVNFLGSGECVEFSSDTGLSYICSFSLLIDCSSYNLLLDSRLQLLSTTERNTTITTVKTHLHFDLIFIKTLISICIKSMANIRIYRWYYVFKTKLFLDPTVFSMVQQVVVIFWVKSFAREYVNVLRLTLC